MTCMNELVTVRGVQYTVIAVRSAAGCGSKGFGKWFFTLRDGAGNSFEAYGKIVGHNSRLRAV